MTNGKNEGQFLHQNFLDIVEMKFADVLVQKKKMIQIHQRLPQHLVLSFQQTHDFLGFRLYSFLQLNFFHFIFTWTHQKY